MPLCVEYFTGVGANAWPSLTSPLQSARHLDCQSVTCSLTTVSRQQALEGLTIPSWLVRGSKPWALVVGQLFMLASLNAWSHLCRWVCWTLLASSTYWLYFFQFFIVSETHLIVFSIGEIATCPNIGSMQRNADIICNVPYWKTVI